MRQPKWNKKSDKREENPMTKNIEGERNLKLFDSSCIIPQHIPLVPNDDAFHSEIPIFTFCNLADVFKNFSKRNSTTNEYIRTRCFWIVSLLIHVNDFFINSYHTQSTSSMKWKVCLSSMFLNVRFSYVSFAPCGNFIKPSTKMRCPKIKQAKKSAGKEKP